MTTEQWQPANYGGGPSNNRIGHSPPFTWWWPSSVGGKVVFWLIIILSGLTGLIAGPMAIINVAFWYLVAVGVRFVNLKATGKAPRP